MKRTVVTFMLAIALLFSSIGIVTSPVQASAKKCADVLSKMTDPLALRMEAGEKVIWKNVDPKLISAKDKYIRLIRDKGWRINIDSAYRPYEYQRHLYEIVQNPTICKDEKLKHGLGTEVAKPSKDSPHTAGKAFDATVYDKNGQPLNGHKFVKKELIEVAKQAGLSFPMIQKDGVHHTLL
ncbi:D-alanyl-D-alanine carboxypeptidase family protein [Paenibacillus ehimensis]|uniref:D-alanyl-D-alanine carboxypeptidase family protein n=1 Tax=Paenibacillus ehimensis TaxID=79264 RepID=UPI002DB918FB|nr:D-alanyl-D-alanine carboxypeptidase family protein [Paenibacillus ehimensis]MEC0208056.1 D-alanyl-D-alanine carboxypeptidase family protein [Paenibacillus ehimensis]